MSPCLRVEWLKVNVPVGGLTEDNLEQCCCPKMRGGGQLGNFLTQHTRQPNIWDTYSNYIDTCAAM